VLKADPENKAAHDLKQRIKAERSVEELGRNK